MLYAALFRAAADTLLAFGRDPRHLGGTIGVTVILHTWGQNLSQHLHLHCVVTGALSMVFRAKYLDALRQAFDLLHVVPRGFVRIRYFGLLANRCRRATLDQCRVILAAPTPAAAATEPPPPTISRQTMSIAVPTVVPASCA